MILFFSSGKISTTDPRTIRIMTTQVTFSDDVTKVGNSRWLYAQCKLNYLCRL